MSAPGRRPLKPLSPELPEPVAQFTEALRQVYLERTQLNQRELAAALHLTKSPVSRYLNGQEIIPADTFAELCRIAGLTPRQQQQLGSQRERAETALRAASTDQSDAVPDAVPAAEPAAVPVSTERNDVRGDGRRTLSRGLTPGTSPRRAALAAGAAVLLAAGAVIAVQTLVTGGDGEAVTDGNPRAGVSRSASDPSSGGSCRPTRVYRVLEDGDILDGRRNDIGDVRADDLFGLDDAPASSPYRFRDYGHVVGSEVTGYVDQAKLKPLGRRCLRPDSR